MERSPELLSESGDSIVEEIRPVAETRPEPDSIEISSSTQSTILEVETDEEPEVVDDDDDDGVISVPGQAVDQDYGYFVEESKTEGRLTEVMSVI